ncbi:MAG: hypothetical protein OJF50_005196 [Nitrospira sp.]|jgi:hypothetical protein|nr:hypothetical protein [Nitrospira sp.]
MGIPVVPSFLPWLPNVMYTGLAVLISVSAAFGTNVYLAGQS